jgi:hypothetical protein
MGSCIVKLRWSLLFLLLLLSLDLGANGQHRRNFPAKPQAADPQTVDNAQQESYARSRVDPVHLQQEALELSTLAQKLPQDIDAVNRGLLPKDTVNKLKRVEKLAKRLRKEITP